MPSLMFRAIVLLIVYPYWCHERAILFVSASLGDRLEFYDSCLSYCKFANCSNDTSSQFPYCNSRDDISCENNLQMDQETQFYTTTHSYVPSVAECRRWSKWLQAQNLPGLECNFNDDNGSTGYTFANDASNDGAVISTRYASPITSSSVFTLTSSLPFRDRQPAYLRLLGWSCVEECKYQCQWKTIDFLMSPNVGMSWSNIPQFYGKWTFRRILGLQEPASALFSLFNLLSLLIGWSKYHKKIDHLLSQSKLDNKIASINSREPAVAKNPFYPHNIRQLITEKYTWIRQFVLIDEYYFVHCTNTLFSVNAWISSIVFHTHDLPVTEKMDYFSAFALVLFNLFSITFRILNDLVKLSNNKSKVSDIDTCNNFNKSSVNGSNSILAKFNNKSHSITTDECKTNGRNENDEPKTERQNNFVGAKGKSILNIFDSISFSTRFITLLMPFVSFYVYHINYLVNVKFDYGYNMKVNTVAGVSTAFLIIFWIILQIFTSPNVTPSRLDNLKFGIFSVLYVNSCFLLELCDFPPIFYASLDPHSLWHLTTIPFPLLWFRYVLTH